MKNSNKVFFVTFAAKISHKKVFTTVFKLIISKASKGNYKYGAQPMT